MRRIIFICLIFFLLCGQASTVKQSKSKLSHLQHSIAHIKAELSSEQQQRQLNTKQLKQTQKLVKNAQAQLKKTQKTLKQQRLRLVALKKKLDSYQQLVTQQIQQLSQQIKAAYMLPHAPMLKLILQPSDSAFADRLRIYYHYLAKQNALAITQSREDLQRLQHYQIACKQHTKILQQLHTRQQQQKNHLELLKRKKKQLISHLNHRILSKSQQLKRLINNKRRLENTITKLQHSATLSTSTNLKTLQGHLDWPTHGKITHNFGTKIYQSELRWNGVVIAAPENNAVHAISDGTVVYSGRLPGYGLLIIINHGKGYMSLYGRNHHLYKALGSIVHRGDTIADVGTGLYFAIRHNATPLNPALWCHLRR